MGQQVETLAAALDILRLLPRLTSFHSYAATGQLLDLLDTSPPPGIILHWWLGDAQQTRRARRVGLLLFRQHVLGPQERCPSPNPARSASHRDRSPIW